MDRKAMYRLSYGLFVLTAREAEKDNGCIINTAIQAASEPNQLSICVNKTNYTHDMIERTGKFTVSVLSQNAQFELFKHFGFQSGRSPSCSHFPYPYPYPAGVLAKLVKLPEHCISCQCRNA